MKKARLLLGALILAACSRPAAAALPSGAALPIPADAPTLSEIEAAAGAPVPADSSPGAGLIPMRDPSGNVVVLAATSGAYGGAFTDAGGNTIISYQATQRQSQYDVAEDTLAGDDPSSLPAYSDALAFARQVVSLTASQGRSPKQVYLTGFSEGGILASFVAWHTGLPGVSFASCGLPGYSSSSAPVNNFISFLESGDPFAQYGTDTLEQASAVVASAKMDHYGIVLQLETSGNDIKLFAQTIAGHDLTQEEDGSLGLTQAQLDAVEDEANELFSQYHNLSLYSSDANTLAAEYGY